MKEVMQLLVDLQTVDNEMRGLATERTELASQIERIQGVLSRGKDALEEKRRKLVEAELFYRDKNQQLRTDMDKANRTLSRLGGNAKQKEYLAAQRELETLKRTNASQEEEILKLLEAIEGFKKQVADDEARVAELEPELTAVRERNGARIESLASELQSIESRKGAIARSLPQGILRRYERTLAAREGLAVVAVNDGTCQGCKVRIPPQQFIQLQRMVDLMNCPSCQRFLYVQVEPASVEEIETDLAV